MGPLDAADRHVTTILRRLRAWYGHCAMTGARGVSIRAADSANVFVTATDATGRATEATCGISVYLGQHAGFTGAIKQRYSDFIVREIDMQRQVVRLSDVSVPDALVPKQIDVATQMGDERFDRLLQMTSDHTVVSVKELLSQSSSVDSVIFPPCDDKAQRSAQHQLIKSLFPELQGDTVDVATVKHEQTGAGNDKVNGNGNAQSKAVRVLLSKGAASTLGKRRADGTPVDRRNHWHWQRPSYIHFTL